MEISQVSHLFSKNYQVSRNNNLKFCARNVVSCDSYECSDKNLQESAQLNNTIISEMEDVIRAHSGKCANFTYPDAYKKSIADGNYKFGNWEIFTGKFFVENQMNALEEKFGMHSLIPFALEENSNMIACFVPASPESKIIEFDAFGAPFELDITRYKNFAQWKASKS